MVKAMLENYDVVTTRQPALICTLLSNTEILLRIFNYPWYWVGTTSPTSTYADTAILVCKGST